MAEDSHLERTEPASPRKLEQAREQGNVARSPELTSLAVLGAALAGLWFGGESAVRGLIRLTAQGLTLDAAAVRDSASMISRLHDFTLEALFIGGPLLGATVIAALVAPLAVSGWSFSATALQPKFDRINPLQGFSRMFSTRSLAELGKALLKASLIGAVACVVLWQSKDAMLQLAGQPFESAMGTLGEMVMVSVFSVAGVMILIACADVPLQLWQHAKGLRMTLEEVKREHKESEGDPHVKAAIRAQQRAAAKKRMMADVPKADVIVTNPTHYAVALKYSDTMAAPMVVAKGVDLVAANIRGIAEQHHVPILEAPPLARALFAHTEIGQQIPEKLYTAVAEVLAYVFQLRTHGSYGVKPLGEVEVPSELDPLAVTQ
jgi:flagellar biosynthesis protein FlhB